MPNCQLCGSPTSPIRKYCSRFCFRNRRSAQNNRTCQQCGAEFHRRADSHKVKPKYCSPKCQALGRRKSRIHKTCPICYVNFDVGPSLKDRVTCSKKCQYRYLKIMERPSVSIECEKCKRIFRVKPHDAAKRFCSTLCANTRGMKTKEKTCKGCGKIIQYTENAVIPTYCNRNCWRISRKTKPRKCPTCHLIYETKLRRQIYCTPKCQQVAKRNRITLLCAECHQPYITAFAKRNRSRYCSKPCQMRGVFISAAENAMTEVLISILGEKPIRQFNEDWLVNENGYRLYLDAYFPENNLAFEYDGNQHFEFNPRFFKSEEEFRRAQLNSMIKDSILISRGVYVLHLRETEPKTRQYLYSKLEALADD